MQNMVYRDFLFVTLQQVNRLLSCADVFHSLIFQGNLTVIPVASLTCRRLGFKTNLYGFSHRQGEYTHHLILLTINGIMERETIIHSGNAEPYVVSIPYRTVTVIRNAVGYYRHYRRFSAWQVGVYFLFIL